MKLRLFFICSALVVLCWVMAQATGTILLPKTGQTASYAAGDDGALQTGAVSPLPRFTDNSDGTVTDNLTGLIWLKNANCTNTAGGIVKSNGNLTWADALTWCNSLSSGTCDLSDGSTAGQWRLPNVDELESLVDLSQTNPALPTVNQFSNVQTSIYWSSSTDAYDTGYAWYVNMYDGSVKNFNTKTYASYVWPVRGGQVAVPAPTISGTPSSAIVGIAYTFTPTTSNATTISLTAGTLPLGLSLNASSGTITGTPTTAGTYSGIQITATGSGGSTNLSGLSITVIKNTPSVSAWPTASGINRGQALSASTLSGGTASVPGTFAFTNPATVPGSTGIYSTSVTFTPTNSANYNTASGTVTVAVSGGPTSVPVLEGWWLVPGLLAGVGIFARRRKE